MDKFLIASIGILIGAVCIAGVVGDNPAWPTLATTRTPIPTDQPPIRKSSTPTYQPAPRGSSLTENAYVSGMTSHGRNTGNALTELGALMGTPQLGNDSWNQSVAVQIAIVRISNQSIAEMQPPARFSAVHNQIVRAFELLDEALQNLAYGIDHRDLQRVDLAHEQMLESSRLLNQATATLLSMTQ